MTLYRILSQQSCTLLKYFFFFFFYFLQLRYLKWKVRWPHG